VYLNSRDAVLHDDSSPLPIDSFTIRQETHAGLDHANLSLGFSDGQTKTIARDGPSHCIPKLSDILVRIMKSRALHGESSESCINEFMLGVEASGNAEQDVRVDQTRGNSHLVVILVNPFP
jgi:hypothetical protein